MPKVSDMPNRPGTVPVGAVRMAQNLNGGTPSLRNMPSHDKMFGSIAFLFS